MREICINCPWYRIPDEFLDINGTQFHLSINYYNPKSEIVIDMGNALTSLASKYPVEQRLFVGSEPNIYMRYDDDIFRERIRQFYGAIWCHSEHLSGLQQYRFNQYCVSWTNPEWLLRPLQFGIGGIFSSKNEKNFDGYAVRRKIESLEDYIIVPSMIYTQKKSWQGKTFDYPQPSKQSSLEWMFHLSIENTKERYYFSEKIVDTFLCRSVPIYYGDPCIGDVFDERGIIRLDEQNILEQLNRLTEQDYLNRLVYIESNYLRAQKYRKHFDQILEQL